MHSLSDIFPDRPRGAGAEARLIDAYQAVFGAGLQPSQEDRDLVLSDLAHQTSYFRPTGAPVTADERAFADGRRWVMARILEFVGKDGSALMELRRAASREHAVDYPSKPRDEAGLDDYD